jgi:transposase
MQNELRYSQLRARVTSPLELRVAMVRYALAHGVKPAARAFGTSPQTIRLWLGRYRHEGLAGLKERSHRPKKAHPQATPEVVENRVVALRQADAEAGQDRIAALLVADGVSISGKTVGKILRKHHLISSGGTAETNRATIYTRRLKPFDAIQLDMTDLYKACGCKAQIDCGDLPRYGFSLRDVATGAGFVAYARVLGAHNILCFVERTLRHLYTFGLKPRVLYTLDKSEWFRHNLDRALVDLLLEHAIVPSLLPPDEADLAGSVTAFNRLLERDFYRISTFADEPELLAKAWAFERWFNLERRDLRRKRSPLELTQRQFPGVAHGALELEPISLDTCIC